MGYNFDEDFIAFEEEIEIEQTPERKKRKAEDTVLSEFLLMESPWLTDCQYSSFSVRRLHEEIQDFCEYIVLSDQAKEVRNNIISQLTQITNRLFPNSELKPFGSFVNSLALPSSDVDLVLLSNSTDKPVACLKKLSRAISRSKMALRNTIKVISKTKVPVIRFVEKRNNIRIDICCDFTNGLDSIPKIKELIKVPALKELVLVVKQYLTQRELNIVYNGGLGAYSLILMVSNFLELHPYIQTKWIDPLQNLGVLLIEFFELFGRNFNYEKVGISFNKYFDKDDVESNYRGMLSIQDPNDDENDMARSTTGVNAIKQSFEHAYYILVSTVTENNGQMHGNGSILSSIIQINHN